MLKPSRRNATPVVVRQPGVPESAVDLLERVPLDERQLSEGWLQGLLFEHPSLLAVEEIEPDYGPLVPLGREVPTAVGPIDALFVSPSGLLTLVEAKLWRNPQARREVVGQILDYARQLSSWSFEELDGRVRRAHGVGVWDAVNGASEASGLLEDEFVDAVARNLRRGRFLLLIVGDGIRESVEELADFLQGTPEMRFTLAMLELGLYHVTGSGELLVVPSVVARTREVVRAVVDVSEAAAERVSATALVPQVARSNSPARSGRELHEALEDDAFFASVGQEGGAAALQWARDLLEGVAARGALVVESGTSSKIVKINDPQGSGRSFTLLGFGRGGTLWVKGLANQVRAAGQSYASSAERQLVQRLSELFGQELVNTDRYSPEADAWRPAVRLADTRVSPSQVLAILDEYLEAIGQHANAAA